MQKSRQCKRQSPTRFDVFPVLLVLFYEVLLYVWYCFGTIVSFSLTGWSDFGVKEPSVSVGILWLPLLFAIFMKFQTSDLDAAIFQPNY